jgi:prephenate dehydrogenase
MPLLGQDILGALSQRIAILGPGLIGGSLALALAQSRPAWQVSVWARREEAASEASGLLPHAKVSSDLAVAVGECDLAVLCISPHAIAAIGPQLKSLLPKNAIVTDAGSVKENIVSSLHAELGGRFIGAHPMAGSEQSGIRAARTDLFQGAVCILTPTPDSDPAAVDAVRDFWEAVGCKLHEMSPAAHDHAIARVSHLPHAAAASLVHAALSGNPHVVELAGGGYRDSTRIAASAPAMWAEILLDNKSEVIEGIADLQSSLETLKIALQCGDKNALEDFLSVARTLRYNQPQI